VAEDTGLTVRPKVAANTQPNSAGLNDLVMTSIPS
jgi:hypothetical protein